MWTSTNIEHKEESLHRVSCRLLSPRGLGGHLWQREVRTGPHERVMCQREKLEKRGRPGAHLGQIPVRVDSCCPHPPPAIPHRALPIPVRLAVTAVPRPTRKALGGAPERPREGLFGGVGRVDAEGGRFRRLHRLGLRRLYGETTKGRAWGEGGGGPTWCQTRQQGCTKKQPSVERVDEIGGSPGDTDAT